MRPKLVCWQGLAFGLDGHQIRIQRAMGEFGGKQDVINCRALKLKAFSTIMIGNFGWVDHMREEIRDFHPQSLSNGVQGGDRWRGFIPLHL